MIHDPKHARPLREEYRSDSPPERLRWAALAALVDRRPELAGVGVSDQSRQFLEGA